MPPETLRTFAVTPDDIAVTFKDPEKWERYKRFAPWFLEGLTAGKAAKNEGLSSSRKNPEGRQAYRRFRDDFRQWLPKVDGGRGAVPPSVNAVGALHQQGIFPGIDGYSYSEGEILDTTQLRPFNVDNPRFRAIALLSGLQAVEGSLAVKEPWSTCASCYFASPEMHDPRMVHFLSATTGKEIDESKDHLPVDAYHARLLGVLGNYVGNHSEQPSADLPRPIMAAIRTLKRQRASDYQRAVAQQTLIDFTLMLFGLDKITPLEGRYRTCASMHSPALPTADLAEERARLFLEILTQSELVESASMFTPRQTSDGNWTSALNLRLEESAEVRAKEFKDTFFERVDAITKELE